MTEESGAPHALDPSNIDYVTSLAKSALGAVPFAGSLLAEIAGSVIPNQRIERLVKFALALEDRLSGLEKEAVRANLRDENFTELVEEAVRQAARSTSDERRKYIAAIVANSLTKEEVEHQESKHLLRILGELNDVEVLWLRFYLNSTYGGDLEFRAKHEMLLRPVSARLKSEPSMLDKEILQDSYLEHLEQLRLLGTRYRMDRDKKPELNRRTGRPEVAGYEITSLGRLFLRHIGLAPER